MSNNPDDSPMRIAANARDKFQASARELLRNLEDIMTNRHQTSDTAQSQDGVSSSFENAIRTIFTACGAGATANVVPPREESCSGPELSNSVSLSSSSKSRSTPAAPTPSKSTDINAKNNRTAPMQRRHSHTNPTKLDFGEHIYEQLFNDDADQEAKVRAEKAVMSLRGNQEIFQNWSRIEAGEATKQRLKPFPVSSPNRPKTIPSGSPLITAEELNIPANLTFDDGISAISAHTLELMAQTSNDNETKEPKGAKPRSARFESPKIQNLPPISPVITTPLKQPLGLLGASPMPRIPSTQSGHSGRLSTPSKASKHSRSTETTQSSTKSFERWQEQEQQFWSSEVNPEEAVEVRLGSAIATQVITEVSPTPGPKKTIAWKNRESRRRSKQHDGGFMTGDRHPHETFHFETTDIIVDDEGEI